jgi:hypothetical protein
MVFMESAVLPSESLAPWTSATVSFAAEPATPVRDWWERAHRVYPDDSQKAWRAKKINAARSLMARVALAIGRDEASASTRAGRAMTDRLL